jgi:uncharacterized protein YkwD
VRAAILIAFVLVRSGCNDPAAPALPATSASPAAATPDDPLRGLARKVLSLGNRQRRLHGLHELRWNVALAEQARLQSMNMMERGFFSHIDPVRGALSARLQAAGIQWSRCGENIFREQGMEDPPDAAVEGWMKSHAHRQSLLDPLFTETGVGIAISPDTEYFITQEFIRPLK